MAKVTYSGTGAIASTDFHSIKYEGLTKGGKAITIKIPVAINKGNIDWTFAEKSDTVAEVTFTGCYTNTDAASSSTTEPFTIELEDGLTAGASEILLGVGKFYIDDELVALTRGGGQFTVEREFRDINADGDRGTVQGRVTIDASVPTLKLTALTFLTSMTDLYPAISQA